MALSAAIPMTNAAIGVARAADVISPGLAARVAAPMFGSSRPVRRVRDSERGVHETARRSPLPLPHGSGVVYEWGAGPRTVLLVHGWRGRASQFAPIVRELRAAGCHLVAFDAPAHGDGYGRRTVIRTWIDAIDAMHQRYGRFEAIIGHSLGALTAINAVREGVASPRVAAIAPVSSGRYLFDTFAGHVGLSDRAAEIQRDRYRERVFSDFEDPWRYFDAVRAPMSSDVELLLVHDRDDSQIAASESMRLHAAHGENSRLLLTSGLGHGRVLAADQTLDAVSSFVDGGLTAVDLDGIGDEQTTRSFA
ncbi:alpha/beta hydrolase [Agromyces cerinus]|uniref:Alpha/beta hydrolase family protein n=1 Tax=Agromyces cerinus subsp. cerinus TaxID=232089 RepID=A0A1N6GAQ2_9MICO|nr:alpha/beta hydrolase [Agromyces cerinus]SIO04605.1 Alpha/beta hydrolase family protein [Agromyces cerinus subsp. cerinus]